MYNLTDLIGEVGEARGWVLHIEQLLREPIEIVDSAGQRHCGDGRRIYVPMRAYNQDGATALHRLSEGFPRRCISVDFNRVHRAAMSDERRRHCVNPVGGSQPRLLQRIIGHTPFYSSKYRLQRLSPLWSALGE
jgi:hypothetical protein